MRLRTVLVFLLAAAALFQLAVPAAGFYWLPPLDGYQLQVWISAGLLGLGTLLSLDVLWTGLRRALRGRVGMDTLAALSVLFTLADALTLSLAQDRCCPGRAVLPAPRQLPQALRPAPVLPHRRLSGRALCSHPG